VPPGRAGLRELHGVDLRDGVARHRAKLIGVWPVPAPPAEGGHPSVPCTGWAPGTAAPAWARRKKGGR